MSPQPVWCTRNPQSETLRTVNLQLKIPIFRSYTAGLRELPSFSLSPSLSLSLSIRNLDYSSEFLRGPSDDGLRGLVHDQRPWDTIRFALKPYRACVDGGLRRHRIGVARNCGTRPHDATIIGIGIICIFETFRTFPTPQPTNPNPEKWQPSPEAETLSAEPLKLQTSTYNNEP